jgi:hypothetical protein
MIELKVLCDCGQKFKFEVEPVGNQMPFTVACPICQRDGTGKANQLLQQMSVFKLVEPAPAAAPSPATPPPFTRAAAAPAATAPPPIDPPAPAASAPARLRVSVSEHPAAPPPLSPPPLIAPEGVVLPPTSGRARTAAATGAGPEKKTSFALGILGGFLGALVGSIIYYAIFKATGVRAFLTFGVAALAGVGAYWLSKGEGSKELGGITVVFVIVGVFAAQYFVLLGMWNKILDEGYADQVKEARQVVKAVPTGSDAEIRSYLASQSAEEGETIKPSEVRDADIQDFKQNELPEYQGLASGKVTREQYLAKFGRKFDKKSEEQDSSNFKGFFILETCGLTRIIVMVVAAGVAYKLSTNA